MRPLHICAVALFALISLAFISAPNAEPTEKRIALVVGNAAYRTRPLATAANDAGLIAQTLQAAGFDVVGARDLDQDSLRRALREFLDKAASAGPDTVAFIYLSGYGLQLEGENYFLPVDADIHQTGDVAVEALRLSDYLRRLGSLRLKGTMVVLDAARANPFSMSGEVIAGGLALVEPSSGMLIAFNAAPGTIAPERDGPYGVYAQALAEMMREAGLSPGELFERVRLRVNDVTKGAQVPWIASRIDASFVFFEQSPDAPAPVASTDQTIHGRELRELAAPEAYLAALARDSLDAFEEFLATYPSDPMARRVRALLAARREAIIWRLTVAADTPEAYWSYLRRYPHGPHGPDALRRLALRAFAAEPPASFAPIDYNVPPPSPDELPYVERPAIEFTDADFPAPPALPTYVLGPPPIELIELPAPPPPVEVFALPIPIFVPLPVWCHRPAYVAAPPDNVIFNNIHNRVVMNHVTRVATIADEKGRVISSEPHSAHGAIAIGTPLPSSLTSRAALPRGQQSDRGLQGLTPSPLWRARQSSLPMGRPLPGADGRSLPQVPERLAPHIGSISPLPSRPAGRLPGARPEAAIPRQFRPTILPRSPHWQWQPPAAHGPVGSAPIGRPQTFSPPAHTAPVPAPSRVAPQMPPAAGLPQTAHPAPTPMSRTPTYRPPAQPPHSAFGLAMPSPPQISPPPPRTTIPPPVVPRIPPPAARIAPPPPVAHAAPPPIARIAPPPVVRIAPPVAAPPAVRPPAPPVQARVAPPAPAYRPPPAPAPVARPAPPAAHQKR